MKQQIKKNTRKSFASNMTADISLSKTKLCKIIQSSEFLCHLLSKFVSPLNQVAVHFVKMF